MSYHDLQSYLISKREAVWPRMYATVPKQDSPSELTKFGERYPSVARFNNPTTTLQIRLNESADQPSILSSRAGAESQGADLAVPTANKWPTDGDLDDMATKLEAQVLIHLGHRSGEPQSSVD